MNEFFLHFLNKMEIFTGIKQMERLQAKAGQFAELVDECAKAAEAFPLKEDILKSVLFDAMQTDQDFIGLNVKWVRKVLNTYCQVHGVTKENQREEKVDLRSAYQSMIDFWSERTDLDPSGERKEFAISNYQRVANGQAPIDDLDGIQILADVHSKQILGGSLDVKQTERTGSGTRLRENIERSTGNQKFVFDGFEIWAKTEEEARNIYETQVGKR